MSNNDIKLTTFSWEIHNTNYYPPNNTSETIQNDGNMSGKTVTNVKTVKFIADQPKPISQDHQERVNSGKKVSFSSKISYCSNSNKKEGLKWLVNKQIEAQYNIEQKKLELSKTS
jgi:hypothetical protein